MPADNPLRKSSLLSSPVTWLLLILISSAAIYWPGLSGSYVFDDLPNIVNNKDLQIHSVEISDLASAALSSPSSEFKRPLASLSFAANFLLTGLNPFWMKLTNLLIHLVNGALVYALSLTLIRGASPIDATLVSERDTNKVALWITAGWLLLPINLTAVLYVVQRMEILANLFVLLGLLGYVHARQKMQKTGQGPIYAFLSLAAASGIGLLCKETAVMTPLYAALIEWIVFGARKRDGRRDYRIIMLFFSILFVPLIIGLAWQLPRLLNSGAWANRNFDLSERLLTEARVVVEYIRWTLLPTPQALSFYHDEYLVSTSWLAPWTTLPSILLLAALGVFAITVRRRVPLVALGLALFIGAQLLTGTILPLELIYEHRNYFASFGLLLAVIPILLASADRIPAYKARALTLALLLCLWAAQTFSTALAWGSPLVLSQTLAARAPLSPRAQYGLGYTYIVLSHYNPKSPFTQVAYAPLERAMLLPGASILPEQALIMMNARMGLPIKQEWWDSLIEKLKIRVSGPQDEGSLESLAECVHTGACTLDKNRLLEAFLTALSHPSPSARLMAIYGSYAWNVIGDKSLGLRMLSDAVQSAPRESAYRITHLEMLLALGQYAEVQPYYKQLLSMNTGGALNQKLARIREEMKPHPAAQSQSMLGPDNLR